MTAACDLLEAELALDRVDAELATELPAHLHACAIAFARGGAEPPAPSVVRRAATLRAIENGRAHPLLADRVAAIARLVWPIAVEDDSRVVAARAAPRTWAGLATLAAARDAAARERFGVGFIALVHRLHGVTQPAHDVAWPAPLDGWHAPAAIAEPPPPAGVELLRGARGRTFVVEPGRRVIVVAPAVTSPATAFIRLHEYGHALAALRAPAGLSRVVDEAAASLVARTLAHPLEAAARARRLQLAQALDAIERGISAARPTEHPPWALWHDPGAQAAYVEAEALADRAADLRDLLAADRSPSL